MTILTPVSLAKFEGQTINSRVRSDIEQNTNVTAKRNLEQNLFSLNYKIKVIGKDRAVGNFFFYFNHSPSSINYEDKAKQGGIFITEKKDFKEPQKLSQNNNIKLMMLIKLIFENAVRWLRPAVELVNFSFKCLNDLALVSISVIKELNIIKNLNVNLGANSSYPPIIQNKVNYNVNIYLVEK